MTKRTYKAICQQKMFFRYCSIISMLTGSVELYRTFDTAIERKNLTMKTSKSYMQIAKCTLSFVVSTIRLQFLWNPRSFHSATESALTTTRTQKTGKRCQTMPAVPSQKSSYNQITKTRVRSPARSSAAKPMNRQLMNRCLTTYRCKTRSAVISFGLCLSSSSLSSSEAYRLRFIFSTSEFLYNSKASRLPPFWGGRLTLIFWSVDELDSCKGLCIGLCDYQYCYDEFVCSNCCLDSSD